MEGATYEIAANFSKKMIVPAIQTATLLIVPRGELLSNLLPVSDKSQSLKLGKAEFYAIDLTA